MEKLNAVSIGSKFVDITWSRPEALNVFPPGLKYRLRFVIRSSWADNSSYVSGMEQVECPRQPNFSIISHHICLFVCKQVIDTSNIAVNLATINLTIQLPYPYTNYEISVQARSAVADETDERFWSKPALLLVKTTADSNLLSWPFVFQSSKVDMLSFLFFFFLFSPITVPCAAPQAELGSFEITSSRLEQRAVTVYWSELDPQCQDGPDFEYIVDVWQEDIR